MKSKKIFALVLFAALTGSMFSGCGSSSSEKTSSSSSNAGGKVTIAVWNEPNSNEELNMYAQCEKKIGIDVEVTVIPESDYSSKLNQMVSTGDDSIDIYVVWENDIANFAHEDGIIALDDYLSK